VFGKFRIGFDFLIGSSGSMLFELLRNGIHLRLCKAAGTVVAGKGLCRGIEFEIRTAVWAFISECIHCIPISLSAPGWAGGYRFFCRYICSVS